MKIEQANVMMNSCHEYSCEYEADFKFESSFKSTLDQVNRSFDATRSDCQEERVRLLLMLEALIASILEVISGKPKAQVTDVREVLETDEVGKEPPPEGFSRSREIEWTCEFRESIREQESSRFTSTGQIKTRDGRSLDFNLDLCMNREFACERSTRETGKAILRDPLIINFDGKAAELSGKRFSFDLDFDGQNESFFGLAANSAYLAIDANNDGLINDGSELFGTRSGDGFADLAKLDSDGNRWLDEADSQFDRLRIWQPDGAGQGLLSTLQAKGVGALYLGSTETPFTLTDPENRTLAQIRASGIYLMESGAVGSLQQVDLAV